MTVNVNLCTCSQLLVAASLHFVQLLHRTTHAACGLMCKDRNGSTYLTAEARGGLCEYDKGLQGQGPCSLERRGVVLPVYL